MVLMSWHICSWIIKQLINKKSAAHWSGSGQVTLLVFIYFCCFTNRKRKLKINRNFHLHWLSTFLGQHSHWRSTLWLRLFTQIKKKQSDSCSLVNQVSHSGKVGLELQCEFSTSAREFYLLFQCGFKSCWTRSVHLSEFSGGFTSSAWRNKAAEFKYSWGCFGVWGSA